jgi:hypothetical protein
LIYDLFIQVEPENGLQYIIDKMKPYIEEAGANIVTNQAYKEKPLDMVRALLDFKL